MAYQASFPQHGRNAEVQPPPYIGGGMTRDFGTASQKDISTKMPQEYMTAHPPAVNHSMRSAVPAAAPVSGGSSLRGRLDAIRGERQDAEAELQRIMERVVARGFP
eukprot:CAMPEP_0178457772 /NCGR_PEP_ID=MMETSP0689_2-20121128/47195_1 /TAXON_ID=160604 /ORGANISM="Amphidinium massartii, Strain CS-259" /LENGTH=105 /DNA_ID=CAMNT_0020084045 /DNA_START=90 /DNA_END=407 /DNA_ORIENTATION=-